MPQDGFCAILYFISFEHAFTGFSSKNAKNNAPSGREYVTLSNCTQWRTRFAPQCEMTLDYCFFCHDKKHFCVVKGHFCSFLVSNIID